MLLLGKTFSMFGDMHAISSNSSDTATGGLLSSTLISEEAGLIPRIISRIWEEFTRLDGADDDIVMTLSAVEIYNEKLRDMLSPQGVNSFSANNKLKVREHPHHGPYIENLSRRKIEDVVQALNWIYSIQEQRKSKSGNASSTTVSMQSNGNFVPDPSKSHMVVTLEIFPKSIENTMYQKKEKNREKDKGKLADSASIIRVQLVDLAGSEKDNRIAGEIGNSMSYFASLKERKSLENAEKQEARTIRQSLSTLGYIIISLGKGEFQRSLPYRDSVLTWLLKDSLSGKSFSSMIATVSPCLSSYEESLNTLKYASRFFAASTLASKPMHSQRLTHGLSQSTSAPTPSTTSSSSISDYIDPISTERWDASSEYRRVQDSLGGSVPGSQAHRLFLKQTLSDPQQRISKLSSSKGSVHTNHHPSLSSPARSSSEINEQVLTRSSGKISSSTTSSFGNHFSVDRYYELEDTCRFLKSKTIELEMELETSKRDRESLSLQLQAAREAADSQFINQLAVGKGNSNANSASLNAISSIEWKDIMLRKENQINKLLVELDEEKQGKASVEYAMKLQTVDLNSKIEALKRYE